MSMILDGTSGLTSPAAVLTTTPLAVTSGGTGVTTSTGTGANVLGTAPTITGATITVASTAAPAFSAYLPTTNQSVTTNVWTKVTLSAEVFDTNSNFDSTTNYRFTPTVAGYYQINASIYFNSATTITTAGTAIYKNGVLFSYTLIQVTIGQGSYPISALIYLNGSSDYLELYGKNTSTTSPVFAYGSDTTWFNGAMVRSA